MKITELELNNFRNYTQAKVKFEDGLNFIVGKNAQGKTNLLESHLKMLLPSPLFYELGG